MSWRMPFVRSLNCGRDPGLFAIGNQRIEGPPGRFAVKPQACAATTKTNVI